MKRCTDPLNPPGNELLLVENWAYLGSAKSEDEIWELVDGKEAQFDKDTYRILIKSAGKLLPFNDSIAQKINTQSI